ncbi:MAG: sulfatase-like hydrolase/transferase [Deinococcota bacterium]
MKQPNVLYIFADQLRYNAVGFNGNRVVQTPQLDGLAREGMVMDEAISSCPICAPYRGQLLTGRYSHANGVMDNEYLPNEGQTSLADAFGQAGYRTAYIGKWHLGHAPFDEAARAGFDDLLAYNNGHDYYNISYWRNEQGPFPMVDFAPFVETQLTLDYIQEHTKARPEQPFCAVLSWGPPHWCFDDTQSYLGYPQQFNTYDSDRMDVSANVPPQFEAFAREELCHYYAMTTALDQCIGKIVAGLERLGLAEDTILCFTSDHGDHLSSHGFGKPVDAWMHHTLQASKATPFEESVHVPFVLRYPAKVTGNQRSSVPFSSVDVMPTLLGLAGLDTPAGVQGQDLSHVFTGGEGSEPDSTFLQILGPGWPTRSKWVGLWRGVRTPRYTYARWHDRDGLRLLFDRERDPLELNNVVDDPEYKDVAEKLEQRLKQWLSDTQDPFDTGARLPATDMLDVQQRLSHEMWYTQAPSEYSRAIEGYKNAIVRQG